MKNSHFLRLCAGSLLTLSALTFTIQSCEKKDKPEDSEEAATEQNDAKFDNDSTGVDNDTLDDVAKFAVAAAEIDMKEIEIGKLAQTKGMSPDVKAHGKMMQDAHTKTSTELKAFATAKNISLPLALTEDGQEAYNKLNEKTGADFDKAYADKMVDGHKKAIEKFEDASKNTKDPELKAWVDKTLPTLKQHLQHSEDLKAKLNK